MTARIALDPRPSRPGLLPLAAAGLAALLPWRAATLWSDWHAVMAPTHDLRGHDLRAGLVAFPMVSATLAAPEPPPAPPATSGAAPATPVTAAPLAAGTNAARPAPLGDDHPSDGRLLAEVARRQAELDKRAAELETRATQVAAAEQLARQQLTELMQLRTEIEKLVVHESAAANADLDSLVGLYANMKPAQAAAVLGKMDPARAAAILQRLDTRAAGPILAAMDPAAALAVSDEVAQRRAAFRR